ERALAGAAQREVVGGQVGVGLDLFVNVHRNRQGAGVLSVGLNPPLAAIGGEFQSLGGEVGAVVGGQRTAKHYKIGEVFKGNVVGVVRAIGDEAIGEFDRATARKRGGVDGDCFILKRGRGAFVEGVENRIGADDDRRAIAHSQIR